MLTIFAFLRLEGTVGVPQGEHSGNETCLMRYHFAKFYEADGRKDTFYVITPGTERIGLNICRSGTGTGANAPGVVIQLDGRDAPRLAMTRGGISAAIQVPGLGLGSRDEKQGTPRLDLEPAPLDSVPRLIARIRTIRVIRDGLSSFARLVRLIRADSRDSRATSVSCSIPLALQHRLHPRRKRQHWQRLRPDISS